jgi:hypothetical protein
MDEIYEERRLALKAMVDSMGRGAIVDIAKNIDVDQSYVSRCLYQPNKPGRKNIGDEMVVRLDEKYPGWRQSTTGFASAVQNDYEQRLLGYLRQLSATRRQVAEQAIVGLLKLEEAERAAEPIRQQTTLHQVEGQK